MISTWPHLNGDLPDTTMPVTAPSNYFISIHASDILQELNNINRKARQETIKDYVKNDHNLMIQKWLVGEIINHTCKINDLDHVKSVPSSPHVKHPLTIARSKIGLNSSSVYDCIQVSSAFTRRRVTSCICRFLTLIEYMHDMPFTSIPHKYEEFVESFKIRQIMYYSKNYLDGYIKTGFKLNMSPLTFITTSRSITCAHIDGKVS